jgi:hypothetical protein
MSEARDATPNREIVQRTCRQGEVDVVKEGKHARGGNWHVSGGTDKSTGCPVDVPSQTKDAI